MEIEKDRVATLSAKDTETLSLMENTITAVLLPSDSLAHSCSEEQTEYKLGFHQGEQYGG